jgi:quinoprotein glucose dehydrogenase
MRHLNFFRTIAFLIFGIFSPSLFAQHGPSDAELSVKKLQPAPGLKVELFASAPLFENPVAFSIDERGRVFIAESHRWKDSIFDVTRETNWLLNDLSFRTVDDRAAFLQKEFATNLTLLTKDSEIVRLVEDRDGDGRAETSSVFADGFNQTVSGVAAGILARHGEVWFTCIPDFWKFTNDDLRMTNQTPASAKSDSNARKSEIVNRKLLATGFGVHIGVSGHDLHGLALGPDGKIYFSSGDRGFAVHTKEGKFLNNPDSGAVLRCNPDGSDLEIFATGLRNPQELAFDQYGNLFTDDNDTAGEDPSRLIYVVEGGDYGWRASYQFMNGYGPWVQETNWLGGIDGTLPLSGEVAQGPSGLAFYPGTGLPDKYENHFLACDFPKGIWSFAVKPKGAGYEVVDKEKFLWNLGATDVDFGPDGSAYALDWGQSYSMPNSGRIYRVFDESRSSRRESAHSKNSKEKSESLVNSSPAEVKKLLSEGMEIRSVEELAKLLGHPDMRVRLDAQFELAKREFDLKFKTGSFPVNLATVALNSTNRLARLHALWGIEMVERMRREASLKPNLKLDDWAHLQSDGRNIPEFLSEILLDKDAEIRAQATKLFPDFSWWMDPALLSDPSPRVRFFAALALGKATLDPEIKMDASQKILSALFRMLKQNADADAYLVHAGVYALMNIGDFDAIQSAAKNKNVSIRRAALLAMRRMERPEIAQFLNDPEPKLVREAARAINDVPINAAMPQLAAMLQRAAELHSAETTANPNALEQILRRGINANFRLGQDTNAIVLANFSTNTNAPEAMRAESLDALSDWENPSQIDRVMGLWRPLPKREIAVAQNAFQSVSEKLFQSNSEKVLLAAVRCVRKLNLNETALFPIFKTSQSSAVRVEILQTLAEFKSGDLPKVVELALASSDATLRAEGIKSIALLAPEQAVPFLERLLTTENDLRIQQTAFATLGKLTNASAADVLTRQLNLLLAGKIAPELKLDLLDAAEKSGDARIVELLNRYKAALRKDDSLAEFRVALVGGDAARGKKIFHEREDVACLRCHAIKGKGGNVGPDLGGIAKRQSRDYLMESILEPNKQIAPGFENIIVTLKSGNVAAGIVKSEDANELILNSPEDGIVKIKKGEIAKRERGLSSMPEGMGKMLTKFELRDLIEFLAELK